MEAVENGGLVLSSSDMFFGSRQNLIMPGRATDMSDGWETRRRLSPGHDWVVIQLGAHGAIHQVEVDTSHCKGNYPDTCSLEACELTVRVCRIRAVERFGRISCHQTSVGHAQRDRSQHRKIPLANSARRACCVDGERCSCDRHRAVRWPGARPVLRFPRRPPAHRSSPVTPVPTDSRVTRPAKASASISRVSIRPKRSGAVCRNTSSRSQARPASSLRTGCRHR